MLSSATRIQTVADATALNAAKRSLNMCGVPLLDGEEADNFAVLLEPGKQVNLPLFNRMVAQSILVGLNAHSVDMGPSDRARHHARLVAQSCTSLGQRLRNALINDHHQKKTSFDEVSVNGNLGASGSPTIRLRWEAPEKDVAYFGGATNIIVDVESLPSDVPLPSECTVLEDGKRYLVGYKNVTSIRGSVPSLQGVPLMPGRQPHLVSHRDFQRYAWTEPVAVAPPNAFKACVELVNRQVDSEHPCHKTHEPVSVDKEHSQTGAYDYAMGESKSALRSSACALVGCLDQQFPMSIPHGYIMTENLPGLEAFSQYAPSSGPSSLTGPEAINAAVVLAVACAFAEEASGSYGTLASHNVPQGGLLRTRLNLVRAYSQEDLWRAQMSSVEIPKEYKKGLELVVQANDEVVRGIADTLRQAEPGSNLRQLAEAVFSKAGLKRSDTRAIVQTLVALTALRLSQEVPVEKLASDLAASLLRLGMHEDQLAKAREHITLLLDTGSVLEVAAKASDVLADNYNQFLAARILTDIRPIFSQNPDEPPNAVGIVHQLKIVHYSNFEHREFFVSLDESDLQELKQAILRAEQKANSVKRMLSGGNVPIVGPD